MQTSLYGPGLISAVYQKADYTWWTWPITGVNQKAD